MLDLTPEEIEAARAEVLSQAAELDCEAYASVLQGSFAQAYPAPKRKPRLGWLWEHFRNYWGGRRVS